MKRIVIFLLAVCMMLPIFGGCSEKLATGTHVVEIKIKDYGTITAEIYADIAPITATNFLKLVNKKFYDGLTFHRIVSGFMIQGGNNPNKKVKAIKGEFASNGVANDLKHTRGVLSMARTSVYNSATSQFFIVQEISEHLDGDYAAFGMVTSGMDVVDQICASTPVIDNNGTVPKLYQPVIESIREVTQ